MKRKLRYPENSASGIKRIINNFSQFLSLVSISAMLIAGIGIANRYNEQGSDLEQPLAIARDIKKLHERLSNQKNSLSIGIFLIENNDLRHVVRRAFISEKFPY